MKSLLIDSSKKSLSLALAEDNKLLFVSNVDSHSKHSNFLVNEIVNILNKANINIYDIDNYIVTIGPGSFTGIRVGVTISKTLAWTLSKKIFTISNLKAISLSAKDDIVMSLIYDKEDYSYVGIYSDKVEEYYLDIKELENRYDNKNITIVSFSENEYLDNMINILSSNNNVKKLIIDDYNYEELIDYTIKTESINPHLVNPIYLKKIDAEK